MVLLQGQRQADGVDAAGTAVAPVLRHAFDDDLAPVEPPEDEPVDLAALAHGPEAVCFPHGIDAEGGAEGHGNGEGPQLRGDEFDAGERALHLMLLDAGLAFPGDLRRGEHPRVGHFKDDVAEGAYAHKASGKDTGCKRRPPARKAWEEEALLERQS